MMISVENIAKCFGQHHAVVDVSFDVKPGEVLGLLGPNGAGKTSSLRMISGLIQPDSGQVHVDGVNVSEHPLLAQKKLGVLPDNCGLYTRLTAAENIHYFAELYGMKKAAIKQRIHDLAEQLDMGNILNRKTQGFSQGERMKVALARALVHRPPYLILDEPTNGLDVLTTLAVRALLQDLKQQGVALIFSSHLMYEVNHLCDRVAIMIKGQIAANGTPSDIVEQSAQQDLESAFAYHCEQSQVGSQEIGKEKAK